MRDKLILTVSIATLIGAGVFAAVEFRKSPPAKEPAAEKPAPPFETVDENYDDMDGKTPEELECVAGKFHDRLFANDENYYRNIETRFGKQTTGQTAWLRKGDVSVEAMGGGCSHYSYSFLFSQVGSDSDTDQQILEKAVALLNELPLTKEGEHARKSILDPMAKQKFLIGPDGTCNFVETEGYSWSECGIERKEGGGIAVNLYYTVAL